jgi:hypothetical protein
MARCCLTFLFITRQHGFAYQHFSSSFRFQIRCYHLFRNKLQSLTSVSIFYQQLACLHSKAIDNNSTVREEKRPTTITDDRTFISQLNENETDTCTTSVKTIERSAISFSVPSSSYLNDTICCRLLEKKTIEYQR